MARNLSQRAPEPARPVGYLPPRATERRRGTGVSEGMGAAVLRFDDYRATVEAPKRAAPPVAAPKPAISVVGLGYVGAVSTACLASLGHRVIGVDTSPAKIEAIAAGQSPIHEAELSRLLADGVAEGLVTATADLVAAVLDTDMTFVSVGTPTAEDGGCDTAAITAVARAIGEGLRIKASRAAASGEARRHTVVMRCSIPPGTTAKIMVPALEAASGLTAGADFGVAFNPEFLREGVAVADFREPPKTVIGASDPATAERVAAVFAPIDGDPVLTSIEVAEMVKYVDNVWHAAKVCFGNEVGRLSKALGIDGHDVMDVFCRDTKLNLSPYYLKPGFAYGGSCLPKEVRAVTHIARDAGVSVPLMASLGASNAVQVERALEMVRATGAKRVGVLGLAFKRGTDDLRESPILDVIAALRSEGVEVRAHDPAITDRTDIAGQLESVRHANGALDGLAAELPDLLRPQAEWVADWSDALIVTHADPGFRAIVMRHPNTPVIDVCRLFNGAPDFLSVEGIGW